MRSMKDNLRLSYKKTGVGCFFGCFSANRSYSGVFFPLPLLQLNFDLRRNIMVCGFFPSHPIREYRARSYPCPKTRSLTAFSLTLRLRSGERRYVIDFSAQSTIFDYISAKHNSPDLKSNSFQLAE